MLWPYGIETAGALLSSDEARAVNAPAPLRNRIGPRGHGNATPFPSTAPVVFAVWPSSPLKKRERAHPPNCRSTFDLRGVQPACTENVRWNTSPAVLAPCV